MQGLATHCDIGHMGQVEDRGLEPCENSPEETDNSGQRGAESGAVDAPIPAFVSDLEHLANVWPTLSRGVKSQVLALVDAAQLASHDA